MQINAFMCKLISPVSTIYFLTKTSQLKPFQFLEIFKILNNTFYLKKKKEKYNK